MIFVVFLLGIGSVRTDADSFTVLTYNLGLLRILGFDLVPMVKARAAAAPAELARFAIAHQPDIILLEEVWEDSFSNAIAKQLAPLGYTAIHPNVHSFLGLSTGLLLLVRAPLTVIDWKFMPFVCNTFTDSFARQGVLEATLVYPLSGTRFVLVGTHTVAVDTNNGVPKDKAQVDVITAQMGQILATLASRSQKGVLPALLLGDFNVGPGYADAIYRIIADTVGICEVGSILLPGDPLTTWARENPLVKYGHYPNEPSAMIDHVFLQNGIAANWGVSAVQVVEKDPVPGLSLTPSAKTSQVSSPLSDHYALLTKVDLSESK